MRLFTRDRHRRWLEDISAYIDDELEPVRKEALERHLESCTSCREELESLRGVVSLLNRVPEAPVPRSFTLAEAPARGPQWFIRYSAPLRYSGAVAALLLIAVVAGDLVAGRTPMATTEPTATELFEAQSTTETGAKEAAPVRAPAPAAEGVAPPVATPTPQPMMLMGADATERAPAEPSVSAPAPEETTTLDALLSIAKVALGAILAALAALIAAQAWLKRRARSRP